MSREIQFDDRLLLPCLGIGLLGGVVSFIGGAGLGSSAFTALLTAFLSALVVSVVLTPIAWFLDLRDAGGRTSAWAALALFWRTAVGLIGVIVLYAFWQGLLPTTLGWISAVSPLLAGAMALLIVAFSLYSLVFDSVGAVRRRKLRASLNSIDISKSKDLSIK